MEPALTPLRRFINLLRVDKQEILSIYVYALFNGIISLTLPLGIQAITNLITGGQTSTSWIVLVVIVILGVAFTGVLQIMQLTITENIQQKIFTRSAFEFGYRIPRLKTESVDNEYIPELVNRFFDTLSVQKGLSKILTDFSSATLQVVFGLILLSLYHPFFIAFSLVLVVLLVLIFRFTAPKGIRTSLVESKYKYEVAHWLEELARAMETFKLAGFSTLPLSKTDVVVEKYLGARRAHFRTLLVQFVNLVSFKVIIAAGLLLIGGLLVINQQMNIGQFVASEIIIILILNSVEKLILSMETIYDVLTAIEKIGAVTDIPLERDTGNRGSDTTQKGISVNLQNLSYSFKNGDRRTLENINFKVEAGEKVCIAGYGGSGKSLMLQIIAGLYENFSGNVSYNRIPLGNWCIEDLRSMIGDSLTREDIFQGTIFENIALGKPGIDMQEVQSVASIVGLDAYVETLPKGYDTPLVAEGKNLPKSIRLRMMLARSIAGNPKLILLEDNFNQLNEFVKKRFLEHLLSREWTVIAISNDVSVARQFEKTLVLKDGASLGQAPVESMSEESWFKEVFDTP